MLVKLFGYVTIVCDYHVLPRDTDAGKVRDNGRPISDIADAIRESRVGQMLHRLEFVPGAITAEFAAGDNWGSSLDDCAIKTVELFKSIPIITRLKKLTTSVECGQRDFDSTIRALGEGRKLEEVA